MGDRCAAEGGALSVRLRAWALACLCALAACTPARREVDGDIVKAIRFEGNAGLLSGQNDYQLGGAMAQGDTAFGLMVWPLMYFVTPKAFDARGLEAESYRLEVWYAHHGWLDAQVLGWHVEQLRKSSDKRAGIVRLVGDVKAGPASLVREYAVHGLEGPLQVLANTVLRTGSLRTGDQFVLDYAQVDRQEMLEMLQNHGRAYASVGLEVGAFPEDQAVDLTMVADPGISARFGQVIIEGNKKVAERFIRTNLTFEPGEVYRKEELRNSQQSLFAMSTFGVVNIEPDLSDPSRKDVPITVKVTETKFRTFRVGAGLSLSSNLFQPKLSASFRHVNVFHELIRVDADAYAGFSAVYLEDAGGRGLVPTYGMGGAIGYPRIAGQTVTLQLSGRFDQLVQGSLFLYQNPRADLKTIWRPNEDWVLEIGPHLEQFFYPNLTGAARRAIRRLYNQSADEFSNPYRITSLDTSVSVDWRDDPLYTRRGSYSHLGTRVAVPVAKGDFSYVSVTGDWRVFRPVRFSRRARDLPLVGAFRVQGKILRPFEKGAALPYQDLAFLGGPSSLRGFRANMVGPYDCLCTYDLDSNGDEQLFQRYYLPRGARTSLSSTAELRYDWAYGISLTGGVDAGVLFDRFQDLSVDSLRWGVATGLRYKSVVGPIRVDFGFRPRFAEDAGPVGYPGCNLEDQVPYRYDVFSQFTPNAENRLPVAMNIFLAIGEAF